ncbi:hypothetical protein L195_g046631, partial [Trifolium pratense]
VICYHVIALPYNPCGYHPSEMFDNPSITIQTIHIHPIGLLGTCYYLLHAYLDIEAAQEIDQVQGSCVRGVVNSINTYQMEYDPYS